MKRILAVVLGVLMVPGAVAQSCGNTSVCNGAQAVLNDMVAELQKPDPGSMSMTHGLMLQATMFRVTVGCLRQCYEAEKTASCKADFGKAIDQFQAQYEQAIENAEEASAGLWSGVAEFDRDPASSEFVRDILPQYGVRVVGDLDSCGY